MIELMTSDDWAAVIRNGDWSSYPTRRIISAFCDGAPPLSPRVADDLIARVLDVTRRHVRKWVEERNVNEGKEDLEGEVCDLVETTLTTRSIEDLHNLARGFVYTLDVWLYNAHRRWVDRNRLAPTVELTERAHAIVDRPDPARDMQMLIDLRRRYDEITDPRTRDILERRARKETNKSIGSHYGISESEVRRIVANERRRFDDLL